MRRPLHQAAQCCFSVCPCPPRQQFDFKNAGKEYNSAAFEDLIDYCLPWWTLSNCNILKCSGKKASDYYVFSPDCHEPRAHADSSTTSHLNGSKLFYLYNILFHWVSVSSDMTRKCILLCVCIAKWGPYPWLRLSGTIVPVYYTVNTAISAHGNAFHMLHSLCQAAICMLALSSLHSLDILKQLKHLSFGCLVWFFFKLQKWNSRHS